MNTCLRKGLGISDLEVPLPRTLAMGPEEFRHAGHQLIDYIANYQETVRDRPVTPGTGWCGSVM